MHTDFQLANMSLTLYQDPLRQREEYPTLDKQWYTVNTRGRAPITIAR